MERRTDDSALWVRNFTPSPEAPVRLVCLPHAGGSASAYHAMSVALAPWAEVLAVQYPGRQDRRLEPCVTSFPELVERLVPVVAGQADHRPLALFGHSMGATVAFEVARGLRRLPGPRLPAVLFLSGRRAPHIDRAERVHLRDDEGILRELRRLGGSAADALADPELLEVIMPAIRGDYRASETYVHVPQPPLDCPVVALTGDADPRAAVPEVEAWREHTEGPFTAHVFPGGHFYLHDRPEPVRNTIRDHLRTVAARGAAPGDGLMQSGDTADR
ncbi:alpha/beta fold hydrolase [Streptomyces sp. NPDC001985]|uniref:thioesterase II family protein n=1 Tax=Streptomyces sp. NPDC001985 TaxID=3154406 RepID=UPI003332B7A3